MKRHYTIKIHVMLMKNNPFRSIPTLLLWVWAICTAISGCNDHEDVIPTALTLHVDTPGSLSEIAADQSDRIGFLTLTGTLNGDDIAFIRELPRLTGLDLSGIEFAEGGMFESLDGEFTTFPHQIVNYMFAELDELNQIILPDNITEIGEGAFFNCSKLTSIIIPDGVKMIKMTTFANCISLASVKIPDSVTNIDIWAFTGCHSLASVNIPDGVIGIGDMAFAGCLSLTSLNMSDGLTEIWESAFMDCSKLTSITIPNSVSVIGEAAFWGCASLVSITLPNSITRIDDFTFRCCTSLTSVTIPNSVTVIGSGAFQGCTSLTSITLPSSIARVEFFPFRGCQFTTLRCYARQAPEVEEDLQCTIKTLYVPRGSYQSYHDSEWGKASESIIEMNE